MFRERYNIKQKDLFHVLTAYSMYNTEVKQQYNIIQYNSNLTIMLCPGELLPGDVTSCCSPAHVHDN